MHSVNSYNIKNKMNERYYKQYRVNGVYPSFFTLVGEKAEGYYRENNKTENMSFKHYSTSCDLSFDGFFDKFRHFLLIGGL